MSRYKHYDEDCKYKRYDFIEQSDYDTQHRGNAFAAFETCKYGKCMPDDSKNSDDQLIVNKVIMVHLGKAAAEKFSKINRQPAFEYVYSQDKKPRKHPYGIRGSCVFASFFPDIYSVK